MGLGDVYLGAPVATPLDPRHRMVTTKYNPARTWTPENAVGIGGAYLCIYGMEGPGGYQFTGRTIPVWNRWRKTADFENPWLLRFFDQLRFYPVSAEELLRLRDDVPLGRHKLEIEEKVFRFADYEAFLEEHAGEIAAFRETQQARAFRTSAAAGRKPGLSMDAPAEEVEGRGNRGHSGRLPHARQPGDRQRLENRCRRLAQRIASGATALILEAMKMEIAAGSGRVPSRSSKSWSIEGASVKAGQALVIVETASCT